MKLKLMTIIILVTVSFTLGQLKNQMPQQVNVGHTMLSPSSNNMLLGFINPDNFKMFHSYNLSFTSFGGNSIALGVYTNSMFYQISDPLSMQVDVSIMYSPYSSFGKEFQKDLSGIYISRAALNWRPTDNLFINIEYRNLPMTYGYYSPFYRLSRLNNFYYDEHGFNDWYIGK